MRVAVVAGPDPGHAFPALALCRRFLAAGDSPTLLTGNEWLDTARSVGVDAVELVGLDPTEVDDDTDAGAKIHQRAARMAVLNVPAAAGLGSGCGRLRCDHRLRRVGGRAARHAVDRTQSRAVVPAVEGTAAAGQRAGARCRDPRSAARRGDAGADRAVVARGPAPALCGQGRNRAARSRIPGRCAG